MMTKKIKELSLQETMERYPRITAHIIAESSGYAPPSCAARILKDAREGKKNYCEWIYSCYTTDPLKAVQDAIRNRYYHTELIADYTRALELVKRSIETGEEPLLGRWF
jgi:hypothetical protein